MADPTGYSVRSTNCPDRYLRHGDCQLWVEAPRNEADQVFAKDATFYRQLAPVLFDTGTALEAVDG